MSKIKQWTVFSLFCVLALSISVDGVSAAGREKYEVGNSQWVLAEQKFHLGELFEREGKYAQAVQVYDQVVTMCPNMAAAYAKRGIAYMKQDDYTSAVADLTKALELDPKNEDAYLNRALIYDHRGEYDLAIEDYTNLIKAEKVKDPLIYVNRGSVYKKKGDTERAIADWREALNIDPNCAAAKHNLGQTV